MSLIFIVVAILLMATSGLPGLLSSRRSRWGQQLAAAMTISGAAAGLVGRGPGIRRFGRVGVDAAISHHGWPPGCWPWTR